MKTAMLTLANLMFLFAFWTGEAAFLIPGLGALLVAYAIVAIDLYHSK